MFVFHLSKSYLSQTKFYTILSFQSNFLFMMKTRTYFRNYPSIFFMRLA